ncbi:MAG: hypothetical protein RL693_2543, partial [Verrucomicrobiota bacterium]
FHADGFGWDNFERFCGAYMVSGTSLPNLSLSNDGPIRLRILDAVRYGTAGAKQKGIDFLATMENRSTWVLQCKHMPKFGKTDAEKAIKKAEEEFGPQNPARYLLWATGTVSPDALDFVHQHHPNWTLWDGERISNEFLLYTPPRQALQIIATSFSAAWGKVFFPLPDNLLIGTYEFYSRWAGEEKLFHHQTPFFGRGPLLDRIAAFAHGGKSSKALILSAPGGIGKTRLLRAVAERLEMESSERLVRFINPEASCEAEPPRFEDASLMTVFHDDAHRLETIPGLLVSILAHEKSAGSRLILASRPGAEDALRERLMDAGYTTANIETIRIGKLKKAEMKQLALSCLGADKEPFAQALTELSDGCALITVVGGELLRRGELTDADLIRNVHFRAEVFRRFEGQELDRIRGSLDRGVMEKLLRSIALLSPWDHLAEAAEMSDHLGIQRGVLESACDGLLVSGLLVRTHQGLLITPDLFSDHLVYAACYDEEGKSTDFIKTFLDRFAETSSHIILKNLAEAEWRAIQQHGSTITSVIAPIWERFLKDFTNASFWDRAQMLERWSGFAVYQPERSLELARWAMDTSTAPEKVGYGDMDNHERVLIYVPGLLKPVAIWSKEYRQEALDLLWRLRRDFPQPESNWRDDPYGVFAGIADFNQNYPDASNGVLDWLERLLEGEDGVRVTDRPCALIQRVLRPYFIRVIERNYMSDNLTMVISKTPVPVQKTKAVRHRALSLLTDRMIPRGTVAAMNALPSLVEAFRGSDSLLDLEPKVENAWRSERMGALDAIADVAERYQHPLIHYTIRHLLRWHIVYGRNIEYRKACEQIVSSFPNTFELRLARFTLSSSHDDTLETYDEEQREQWYEDEEKQWVALKQDVIRELLIRNNDARTVHDFIDQWSHLCSEHGLEPHLGELLSEIALQNQPLAFEILEIIHQQPSELTGYAATLVALGEGVFLDGAAENAVLRGLDSNEPVIVRSFLNSIRYRKGFQASSIVTALISLAGRAEGSVLNKLLSMVEFPKHQAWTDALVIALLERELTDEQATFLANAYRKLSRDKAKNEDTNIVFRLLDRLCVSERLTDSDDGASGFLCEMARHYPRRIYEFLIKRIERQQKSVEVSPNYLAIPYSVRWSFEGIESESDFESLARRLLQRVWESNAEYRWLWEHMFQIVVVRTSSLTEKLFLEHLPKIDSPDDLVVIASLLDFEGSLLVFRYPNLTEAILKKARTFGVDAHDHITRKLIHGAGPGIRSYTNNELNPEHRYLRTEAEKAVQVHESNQTLRSFYEKILEMEIRDEESNRARQDSMMDDDW